MSEPPAEGYEELFASTRRSDRRWVKLALGSVVAGLLLAGLFAAEVWLVDRRILSLDGMLQAVGVGWIFVLVGLVLVWLRGRRTPEVFNQAALVCPRCSQVVAWGRFRVVPWFDPSESDYELTARCDGCWRSTVRETQERLLANIESARERLKFVNCIERLGVRGLDPSQEAELRAQAVRLLEAFAKGAILLPLPDESKPAPP